MLHKVHVINNMFFIALIIVFLILCVKIYCKLTYGINKCSKHLVGKVVIVTGGTTGIGFETAKDLADRGAKVIIACNDVERETTAKDHIISATDNKNVHFRYLDLASLASVRKFADEIIKTEKKLHILINNAGVIKFKNEKTEDGLSLGMQINYFGPFLLTNLLLPLLKSSAPSRIINVSSVLHRYIKMDLENLNLEKETEISFNFMKLYSYSKLCVVLMTVELARLLKGTGVTANSLHPGSTRTMIFFSSVNDKPWTKNLIPLMPIMPLFSRSVWEGAQTSIFLAVSPEVSSVSGRYFTECREENTSAATDTALARKLWEVSERMVKLK